MLELVLGGARSGKSGHAEQLADGSGMDVVYIATSEAWDDEMSRRIELHRQARPAHWGLVESPLALAEAIRTHMAPQRCLLVDCLTLWLTNALMCSQEQWQQEKRALLDLLPAVEGRVVLVSNEVGQGVVPMGELSRRFVDEAGWLHQAVATEADRVWWVVAGLPQCLKGTPEWI
ncbi:bifunctional adenosylcobinamide kinase/adenosylcobinamide-phosphate guanylyltransferase [Phytohalomonas tamaricis]|uniref:bifunctional adenosylcobinamide kinase/adenosylcobinamide-phosphate guanylyltransferase n=1 Tax=Phytohalomonas tamaricis TaxID=2081032 RepID=UPI000D0B1394|nr:bifunctional adenosylcobinamide kinase/adenosylcobinamide-phosphate guanylyltransferase [Phytohalomonas tamaricis]